MKSALIKKLSVYTRALKDVENDTIENEHLDPSLTQRAERISKELRQDLKDAPLYLKLACLNLMQAHLDVSGARFQFKLALKEYEFEHDC